jgi:hypothetical protein
MPTIDITLIDSTMNNLSNQLEKSSIKNEDSFGFRTPPRNKVNPNINPNPPCIKKEYHEARLKRRRSVLANLNDLGNETDDESNFPKVIRLKFPNLKRD